MTDTELAALTQKCWLSRLPSTYINFWERTQIWYHNFEPFRFAEGHDVGACHNFNGQVLVEIVSNEPKLENFEL
jgi:hypothetical protein